MKDEKLTVIGSKSYEECQCVMLPTDKASKLYIAGNNLFNYEKERENGIGNCQNQHLYILSSEEIKEGDWCLTGLKIVRQCNGFTYSQNGKTLNGYTFNDGTADTFSSCKKIIATTDILLTDYVKVEGGFGSYNKLPRPSDDFLKAFVKTEGKINELLVEYEGFIGCSECGREYPFPMAKECFQSKMCKRFNNLKLKVSPDNTITIRAVEEEKKDYGIEYLKFIATRFAHECRLKGVVSNHETCTLFDKWIKENL